MSIQQIVEILTNSGIEPREATIEVKMLIEHFCNYTAMDIVMGRPLDYEKLKIVEEKAKLRAKTKMPIQYIIGQAFFMGDYYKVTKDVLIPRDETELVVTKAIDIINEYGLKSVLDIGSGSGCIACSLSKNGGVDVVSVDVSSKALEIAKENAKRLNLKNVEFIKSDLFKNIDKARIDRFDMIISNPPYIPTGTELQKEVTFEPELALFAEGDGTGFYKKIVENSSKYLKTNGFIIFELGINQSEIVKSYFEKCGFKNISIEKDFAGIDRIIFAHL